MGNILDEIVKTKRAHVDYQKASRPLTEVVSASQSAEPARDFFGNLARQPRRSINVIAEIKRKSPSAGMIRPDFDVLTLARTYQQGGADALSILTDTPYFDGRLEFIAQARQAVPLPVLRKDFMIDPYQLYEARAAGADAILLIGEVLEPAKLHDMLNLAFELGMTSLIEVHEESTLESLQAEIGFPNQLRSLLGINNRNLKIQQTDISTTEKLAGRVGEGTVLVSESGIKTRDDIDRLVAAGARGVLIGETFMKSPDIVAKMNEVLGPVEA